MFVTVALGSNLGNRLCHLQEARDMLRKIASSESFVQSPVYLTSPVDCTEGSPDFYNAVVGFHYVGTASQLHNTTQGIEFHLGRERGEINAPRTIDVDILTFGDVAYDDGLLQIPHPRMLDRRFVLEPLCEIAPDLKLPGDQASLKMHLHYLEDPVPLQIVQARW